MGIAGLFSNDVMSMEKRDNTDNNNQVAVPQA